MRKKVILPVLIVIIGATAIVWYNSAFLRREPAKIALMEKLNPIPYIAYFELEQNKPHAIFQTPIFPEYNMYCKEHWKACQFIPFQQLYADMLWIGSIQYIGVNLGSRADRSLYTLLDTVTTVSPYWSYPYGFSQLVIPMQKSMVQGTGQEAEDLTQERKISWTNSTNIAKKGEYYLCDSKKIAAITGMTQEEFVNTVYNKEKRAPYENPCKSYELPHYMAFNYFYFLGDSQEAGEQYRISAFHDQAPTLTPMMAALVYGRGWEHIKSATLWYDRYLNLIESEDEINHADAERSVQKAIFELQLQLITEAADKHPECGTSYSCLQKNWAIRESIQDSRNNICKWGKDQQNLRCILLAAGLQSKVITLAWWLTYPLEDEFEFWWASEYKSWWAQPK